MPSLPPWTDGPFELLIHAELHLRAGEDFDRRIALISFDNAIEVAITTFLTLHPIQRSGRTYPNEKVDVWLANYHSRLDFVDAELASRNLPWAIERSHIVWAHSQRNEQYHAGNKGVPDKRCLAIAKRAALWLFGTLFDVPDPENELNTAVKLLLPAPQPKHVGAIDRAIDAEFGAIEIANCLFSASDVIFSLDYDAYREFGEGLREREIAMQNDGKSA